MEEREPFPTEDPREQGAGPGYPEDQPERDEDHGARDPEDEADPPDAPSVSSPADSDPGHATGNPDAAG